MFMIEATKLQNLYIDQKLSMQQISRSLNCSPHKVAYWIYAHKIPRRSIGDAVYLKCNPNGDPFEVQPILSMEQAELFGMGIGLYWGEGTKASTSSVRLGNTDPKLLLMFMRFLIELFGVDINKLHFGLQIFTDINAEQALSYWVEELGVKSSQFYKVHVTISGSLGTYRKRSPYGVVTVYFHNTKLRDIIVGLLPKIAQLVERDNGNVEVTSSTLVLGSRLKLGILKFLYRVLNNQL